MKDANIVTYWQVVYPVHSCDHHHRTPEAAEKCGKRNADAHGNYEIKRITYSK